MKRTPHYYIHRINKLLCRYMDNPEHKNAKRLLSRQNYYKNIKP